MTLDLRNRWSTSVNYSEEFKRFESDFRNRDVGLTVGYNTRAFQSAEVGYRTGRNFGSDFDLVTAAASIKPTDSSELQYELQRLVLDPDPEDESTWIHVVRGNLYFTPDLYLQLFYQSNVRIDRNNLQAVFVYRYLPPFGTVQVAFQKGTAEFGQESSQGNTLRAGRRPRSPHPFEAHPPRADVRHIEGDHLIIAVALERHFHTTCVERVGLTGIEVAIIEPALLEY